VTHRKGRLQQLQIETVKNRAMPISPKQSYSKRTVRLPDDLIAKMDAEADRNGRSFNAEIIAKLNEAYAQPTLADLGLKQDEMRQLVRQVLEEIESMRIRK
jgi:hypothetical protein